MTEIDPQAPVKRPEFRNINAFKDLPSYRLPPAGWVSILHRISGAIMFMLFDLEIAFLFPWAVSLKEIGPVGFWAVMLFLAILVVGFVYEWKKGALDWE